VVLQYAVLHLTGYPLSIRVLKQQRQWGPPDPGAPRVRAHGHAAVVALLAHGLASGRLDLALLTRVGRAHAEGLRLIVTAWNQVYRARFEGPLLAAGATSARPWSWPQQSVDFCP
jgi:hypothetical protein